MADDWMFIARIPSTAKPRSRSSPAIRLARGVGPDAGVPRYTIFRREIFATTTRDGSGQRMNSVVRPFGSITFWYGVPS